MAHVETKERVALRRALGQLKNEVESLETIRFGPSELQKARICMVPVAFDPHAESDLNPRFFNPYPADLLIRPKD